MKAARQWAKVLKWPDSSIELVSRGKTGWSDWDRIVIKGLSEFVRWHSVPLVVAFMLVQRSLVESIATTGLRLISGVLVIN